MDLRAWLCEHNSDVVDAQMHCTYECGIISQPDRTVGL